MKQPSFDVVTEPWIPVVRSDHSSVELGIRACLEQAHQFQEIHHDSPLVEFGLYRLLVAFVLDALGDEKPEDAEDLKKLLKTGCFKPALLNKYLEECGDVFDLFHEQRPFLQTKINASEAKPLAGMYPAVPSGTNVGHWNHASEDDYENSAAEAARLLTTISPFMTAGGAGLSPSINGAPAIYVMPVGSNLFETLVLNLPLSRENEFMSLVAWRNKRVPGQEMTRTGLLEALTWRPRCIQLIPEKNEENEVVVRAMRFEKGDSTRLEWEDANLAYRYKSDKKNPVRMQEGRPLWRDAGILSLTIQGERGKADKKIAFRRPATVSMAFEVLDGLELDLRAYGLRTDLKMKVFEWAKWGWSVPGRLGRNTRLGPLLQGELESAEKAAWALRQRIKALYPREGAGNKGALRRLGERCERNYWRKLEMYFQGLTERFSQLDESAPDDPKKIEAVVSPWREVIRKAALDAFEAAAQDMDADSGALERQVRARNGLKGFLDKELA